MFVFSKYKINFAIQSTLIMKEIEVYNTLNEIKDLMEKSSKFLSLSGLSAILVGIYALIGAGIAYYIIGYQNVSYSFCNDTLYQVGGIVVLALILLGISLLTVFAFSWQKAKRNEQKLYFDSISKRLLVNFFIPLLAGGILCFALIMQHHYGLTSCIMLIFYGMALINGSKYIIQSDRPNDNNHHQT